MALRLVAAVAAVFAATAMTWPDEVGDPVNHRGPDIAAVTVTNSRTHVTFTVRFASAPPLSTGTRWVDMLLIGIDVPPIGPAPVAPGGEWLGANYSLGVHGASASGQLVGSGGREGMLARLPVVTRGRTVTMRVSRRLIGNPAWFRFIVASAREAENDADGGFDIAPQSGTLRYVLR